MRRKFNSIKPAFEFPSYTSLYFAATPGLYPEYVSMNANIIFDLGGVLLNLDWFTIARYIGLLKLFYYLVRVRSAPRDLFFQRSQ